MKEYKLKRCPFCGGKAALCIGANGLNTYSFVQCGKCRCKTDSYNVSAEHCSNDLAIQAWNNRKMQDPQIITCKDCVYHNPDDMVDWCDAWGNDTTDDAFCSYAERRQNG